MQRDAFDGTYGRQMCSCTCEVCDDSEVAIYASAGMMQYWRTKSDYSKQATEVNVAEDECVQK